jgi:hypothetical protein
VVYLKGATTAYTITGDGGQGIILADGDLKLAGNFVWTGIILVRGTINLQGNGGSGGVKVTGAIAAMNRANGTNVITGNSSVTFSRCAINQVTSKLATVAPTKYRAWAELSF